MAAVDPAKAATLFCRVSSAKQATGYSPETQERMGREYAARKGLTITRVFQVVETASKKAKRRKWDEYLELVRRGPEKHALVATVDRALRNFTDLPQVQDLQKKHGKTVHFFLEGLVLDGTHASNTDLRLGMSAAVAVWYATELGEKARRGMAEKASKGLWPNRAPLGYVNDKKKGLVVDPMKARIVVRIKQLSATHRHTLQSMVDQLATEGYYLYGKKVYKNLVERVIRSPFYAGRFEWPKGSGNWIKAAHEPLVSWQLHEKAVAGLERTNRPHYMKHDFVFAGMIRCGDCPESRAIVFSRHKGRFIYGHCSGARYRTIAGVRVRACPGAEYVPLKTIEDQVTAILETTQITEEQAKKVLAKLAADAGGDHLRAETQLALLRGQLTKLEQRMAKAYADKLDGKVDEGFWQQHQKAWALEKVQLEESIRRQQEAGPSAFMPQIRKVLELVKNIVPLYKSGTPDEKREIVNFVCLNLKLTGKKLDATMRTPFAEIAEGRRSEKWWEVCVVIRTWATSQPVVLT